MSNLIRIGTRDSTLALWQARHVQEMLRSIELESVLVPVKSTGDINLTQPLYEMGITGVFTKELDIALLNNQIDLAVHSMKDVPTLLPSELTTAFVPKRGNPLDVVVVKHERPKNKGRVIATSSLRRQAQWLNQHPKDSVVPLRGNMQTRLNKLNNENWDGAIFALAGLERLEIPIQNSLSLDWMIPAPAQGALMVVGRESDKKMISQLQSLNHVPTVLCVKAERDFLRTLQGGCSAPIGALASVDNDKIRFKGCLTDLDGKVHVEVEEVFETKTQNIGEKAAKILLKQKGAAALLNKIKG